MERQHLSQTKNAIAPSQTQSHASDRSSTHPIEALQGAIGNRAVNKLLVRQPIVQTKPMFGGLSSEFRRDLTQINEPIQAKEADSASVSRAQTENKTGLPDHLKAGIENLSGIAMDNVRVHYNSSKPSQLQALAYTQGTDIHVAPGQEQHLPHEAWHVVQQKQGRVKPTLQAKGVEINDDLGLEDEANLMGLKAQQILHLDPVATDPSAQAVTVEQREVEQTAASNLTTPIQLVGEKKRRHGTVKRVKSVAYEDPSWDDDEDYEEEDEDLDLQEYRSPRNLTLWDMISADIEPLIEADIQRAEEARKWKQQGREREYKKYKKLFLDEREPVQNLITLARAWELKSHEITLTNEWDNMMQLFKKVAKTDDPKQLGLLKSGLKQFRNFLDKQKLSINRLVEEMKKVRYEPKQEKPLDEEEVKSMSDEDRFAQKYPTAIRIKLMDSPKKVLKGTDFSDHINFVTSTFEKPSPNLPHFDGHIIYHDTEGGGQGGFTIFGVMVGSDRFLIAHGQHSNKKGVDYKINWCCDLTVAGWTTKDISFK